MLVIKDLSFSRGGHRVFEKAVCEAVSGDTVVLSGSNASGKTTLLNCIVGDLKAPGGTITLFGKPVGASIEKISFIPDDGGIIPLLKVDEQLLLQCLLSGLSRKEALTRVNRIVGIMELEGHRDKRGAELSLGLKKRLGIGLGIIREAELFLFDEPFSGLDYASVKRFCRILEAIRLCGKIAVISSHSILVENSLFTRRWVIHDRSILENPQEADTVLEESLAIPELPWLN